MDARQINLTYKNDIFSFEFSTMEFRDRENVRFEYRLVELGGVWRSTSSGENRISKAIEDALNSPLLNTNDVSGASKVLLSLYCSTTNQIKMEEVQQIHDFMNKVGDNVQVIWGATFDDTLGDSVKITIIATGYDVSDIPGMPSSALKEHKQSPSGNNSNVLQNVVSAIHNLTADKTEKEEREDEIKTYQSNAIGIYNRMAFSLARGLNMDDNNLGNPDIVKNFTMKRVQEIKHYFINSDYLVHFTYDSEKISKDEVISLFNSRLERFNNIEEGNIVKVFGRVERRFDKYQVIVNNIQIIE
jgi:hypothetical protein